MFQIKKQPLTDEIKKKIDEGFTRHAKLTIGHDEKFDPIAFIAKENNHFAGASVCALFWGALHIKYLYIDDTYRRKGLGTILMQHTLDYAKEHHCPFAFVETMSFQALSFYQKLGFQLEFTRSGYAHGTSFHYLKKNL